MSKALERLRCSKREVELELQELKSQMSCKEAQIEAEVERLETLQATLQGLGDERRNVGNMLLQQVRKDKDKIKALLDDIDTLGALLCEAIAIRSLIEKDNKTLEGTLERSKCPSEQVYQHLNNAT
jgi:predicted  nucleic acid-binding Zn-ribbon protein